MNSKSVMRVLLIEEDSDKAKKMMEALDPTLYHIDHYRSGGSKFLHLVEKHQPDLILLDVESPDRDIVESLSLISANNPKPVVMFSQERDRDTIHSLVKSGVSAYITGDADPSRVRSIIDVALIRFEEYQLLKSELKATREKLSQQKTVEQAKIWIMETKSLTEKEAYRMLRKSAMDTGQTIEVIAKNMLAVAAMLEASS